MLSKIEIAKYIKSLLIKQRFEIQRKYKDIMWCINNDVVAENDKKKIDSIRKKIAEEKGLIVYLLDDIEKYIHLEEVREWVEKENISPKRKKERLNMAGAKSITKKTKKP